MHKARYESKMQKDNRENDNFDDYSRNIMNRFVFLLFLGFFLLHSKIGSGQDSDTIRLDGDWKFRRSGTGEWLPAKVPGVVHLDLMQNNLIPDPYLQDNESKLQWIGEPEWEYMKTFQFDERNSSMPHIELILKGLDTYANVYLNDSLVLVADNMFREWVADVRHLVRTGINTLRIQFPAIVAENKIRYAKLPFKLPGDEKVVCRKAAYHFGWDWGPALVTCGIWRSVYIREWSGLKVSDVQFIQKKLTASVAEMAANFTVFSDQDDSAEVRIFLDSVEILKNPVILSKGKTVVTKDFSILNP
ncbi:MAG: hypothetical protein NTW16_07510, partial [Bacteroidetes bacterium]|nr:hypothetical protein [Bacteroidota bacterium]